MWSADGALPQKSGAAQIGACQTHALPELQGNKSLHGNQGLGPEVSFFGEDYQNAILKQEETSELWDALWLRSSESLLQG